MTDLDELRHPPPIRVTPPMLGDEVEEDGPPFRDSDAAFEEGETAFERRGKDVMPRPGLWSTPERWWIRERRLKRFLRKVAGGE
jgi:hypothetical protein